MSSHASAFCSRPTILFEYNRSKRSHQFDDRVMGLMAFAKCEPSDLDLNASSISSSDFPLVSGMKRAQTNAVSSVHPPKRKYAPKLLLARRMGVVSATRKLVTQLLPCARLVAEARVRWGWISAA